MTRDRSRKTTEPAPKQKRQKPQQSKRTHSGTVIWLAAVLVLTAVAYLPALNAGFTNWDDDVYVTANARLRQLSPSEIPGLFAQFHSGNYHPLTMLSLALDYRLGGGDPRPFHAVNLALHLISTAFVFWLALLLFDDLRIAVPAAALFGIHTLHVESVAWVSERKDVLYAVFFLASLIAYVKSVKGIPSRGVGGGPFDSASDPRLLHDPLTNRRLLSSLGLFVLSLLAKGQAVTLAPTLLLVDHLFERKITDRRVILEKIPFFSLALMFGIIAIRAQHSAAAIFDHAARSFFDRVLFACYGFVHYLLKLAFPFKLSAVYPYPVSGAEPLPSVFYLCPIVTAAILAAAVLAYKTSKGAFFGIAFFLISIIPVLQLLPVGNVIMADRYTYVPSIGIFYLAGLGFRWLAPQPFRTLSGRAVTMAAGGYILALSFMTVQRCAVWKDSLSLWMDAVSKTPTSETAWDNLGAATDETGNFAESLKAYNRAIALNPGFAKAYANRARCRKNLGDLKGALQDADRSLALRPDLPYAHITLGIVELARNDLTAASSSFEQALRIEPSSAEAYVGRAGIKTRRGDLSGAYSDLDMALRLDPMDADAHSNRGIVKALGGDVPGALGDFETAMALDPRRPGPYMNRAVLRLRSGDEAAACADLMQAQRLGAQVPDSIMAKACGR